MSYRLAQDAAPKGAKRSKGKKGSRSGGSGSARRARRRTTRTKTGTSRSGTRSRTRAPKKKAPKKKYARYDPETLQRVLVTNDDIRYQEWLTPAGARSERKRRARERERLVTEGGRALAAVAPAALPAVQAGAARVRGAAQTARAAISRAAGTRVAVGVGAATVGIGTAAAAAILAGLASYYATTWLLSKLPPRPTLEDVRFNAAVAHGKARREAAGRLGRPLTKDELDEFAALWRGKLGEVERRFSR